MKLKGKRVLLTGATGGIGEAVAKALALAGAQLILTGRQADKLTDLKAQLVGRDHQIVVVDLARSEGRQALLQAVRQTPIDILINNAGVNYLQLFEEATPAEVDAQINLNLRVPMQLTRELLPTLQARPEALIVNVGSILGSIGFAGSVAYSATKFGLRGFSEALRRELAQSSVQVLYFAPRATQTPIHTDRMSELNQVLGNAVDSPAWVAQALLQAMSARRPHTLYLGWPEKLFVRLNGVLPKMVDKALRKQLATIVQYARRQQP